MATRSNRSTRPTLIAVLVLGAWLAGCAGGPTGGAAPPASGATATGPAAASGRPNILFVLTDDMRVDDLQHMSSVRSLIADQGATFDNHLDNVTLCCPARTSILRGQYSHNTGVLSNGGTNGGFETFYAAKGESTTVATALHDAGYRTGLFGKYLNGYPNTAGDSYVPPGWDSWSSASKGNAYAEYDYTLNQNGQQVEHGRSPQDYGTDVYVGQTQDFIAQSARDGKPFFAYLSVYAPHQPATPAPQDADAFPGLQAPRDPSYNEADVSDKPGYIRDLPELRPNQQAKIDQLARLRAQSLQAVDRGVASLVEQLQRTGQLQSTYIVFTSDNGFHLGQHRLPAGKQTAYETDIHLPLLVRGPGVAPGSHVSALTGNVDLAPTFAAWAGSSLADDPDGRSLVPLLPSPSTDGQVTPAGWRQAFLLEHWAERADQRDRSAAAALEPDDLDQTGAQDGGTTSSTRAARARQSAAARSPIPEFQGLRTARYAYVEYVTGEKELYDLRDDPDELVNTVSTADPALLAGLHAQLDELRRCRGDACRQAEAHPVS